MTATFYVGDAVTVMNTLPEKSVDLILTSPPFLALRSYLPQDHSDKNLEGGSQATPGEYIDWLLDVVEACARVLAPHGSLCFELGDTYSGSGESGWERYPSEVRDYRNEKRGRASADGLLEVRRNATTWPLAKSLSLIPETFRWAMVYGHNPHTGRRTEPWRLRNVIRWVRPNPPVGALGDKFRPATSELMVFCKAKDRFFDLDATREPVQHPLKSATTAFDEGGARRRKLNPYDSTQSAGAPPLDWWNIPLLDGDEETRYGPKGPQPRPEGQASGKGPKTTAKEADAGWAWERTLVNHPDGAPPLDWWNIPPGGYPGAHYAVWPPELLVKPIKAMCPEKVCRRCGEASRRIVGEATYVMSRTGQPVEYFDLRAGIDNPGVKPGSTAAKRSSGQLDNSMRKQTETLGFSDCGHNDYRPGLVLDPFAGSGTTLSVATGHGRDAIGIDLDERNYELALDRAGPLILQRGEIRDGTGPPD